MLLKLHLTHFRIYGDTYPHRTLFKQNNLRWDPEDKCWHGNNFEAIPYLKWKIRGLNVYVNSFFPKKKPPPSKQYLTKAETDRRRVVVLKGLECIPGDICQSIVQRALPKFYGCTCAGDRTCINCSYACCAMGIGVHCVCSWATRCAVHGMRCNGTHD